MKKERLVVYDIESFPNFFSYTDIDMEGNVTRFYIHNTCNQLWELLEYLKTVTKMVGFNNIDYDYPLLHYIIINRGRLKGLSDPSGLINQESQRIVDAEYSSIRPKDVLISQLDLFRLWHFNNKARSTSLKWIEIAINYENVEDLPFHYLHYVKTEEIERILEYNENDVRATLKFYLLSKGKLELRRRIYSLYGINATNLSDVDIGERILLKEVAEAMRISEYDLKQLRTYRSLINLGDVILPQISFKTDAFKAVHEWMKNYTVSSTKGLTKLPIEEVKSLLPYVHPDSVKRDKKEKKTVLENINIVFNGVRYDFGLGGIHGKCGSGVWKSTDASDLILVDVSSYYPNLAIKNGFHPEHLPKEAFIRVGEKLYDMRMKAKADGDDLVVAAIKLALNGALFGKSNDAYSFMYDPKFMMSINM